MTNTPQNSNPTLDNGLDKIFDKIYVDFNKGLDIDESVYETKLDVKSLLREVELEAYRKGQIEAFVHAIDIVTANADDEYMEDRLKDLLFDEIFELDNLLGSK